MNNKEQIIKYIQDSDYALFEVLSDISDNLPTYRKLIDIIEKVEMVKGEKGDKGDRGDEGKQGIQGIRGEKGLDGKNGRDGLDGKNGRNGIDGRQGKDGRDGANGKDGENATSDDAETIVKKLGTLKGDKRLPLEMIRGHEKILYPKKGTLDMRWHGGGNIVEYADLSAQCNGVLKTFNLPEPAKVLAVIGSQFPIVYRPVVDYTFTKHAITLTSTVSAPLGGQTLTVLYAKTSS